MDGVPSPGTYATFLENIVRAEPDLSKAYLGFKYLADYAEHWSDETFATFPQILREMAKFCEGDRKRLAALLAFMGDIDFYESVDLVESYADDPKYGIENGLVAARLAANPAANPAVREELRKRFARSESVQGMLTEHLPPSASPSAKLSHYSVWPGNRPSPSFHIFTTVVVMEATLPASLWLPLAIRLKESFFNVRRMDPACGIPNWFGSETLLIAERATTIRQVLDVSDSYSSDSVLSGASHVSVDTALAWAVGQRYAMHYDQ